jgi:hypothetical protein
MVHGNVTDDGKTKASPTSITTTTTINSVKAFKYSLKIGGGNTLANIAHGEA